MNGMFGKIAKRIIDEFDSITEQRKVLASDSEIACITIESDERAVGRSRVKHHGGMSAKTNRTVKYATTRLERKMFDHFFCENGDVVHKS